MISIIKKSFAKIRFLILLWAKGTSEMKGLMEQYRIRGKRDAEMSHSMEEGIVELKRRSNESRLAKKEREEISAKAYKKGFRDAIRETAGIVISKLFSDMLKLAKQRVQSKVEMQIVELDEKAGPLLG